ncbi:DUF1501 domain-containing protein [Anatilimnocola floriformis]|uniref:DUF1501 domain-containing protein n=1 Tax=Anatilimnocola floriformis TaxID=2948575 RepID=UPI0020C302E1|nr:DUF1501 domain-containing protein [Anatilimnocola floriformis]
MAPTFPLATSRRQFLSTAGGGLGLLALKSLLAEEARGSESPKQQPHITPRVKRVIWLFMHGGPSHVDLFDYKPELIRLGGKPIPDSFGEVMTRRKVAQNPLLPPIMPLRQRGESGHYVSDLLPETAQVADDLCLLHSVCGDSVNHPQSVYQMNTGSILMGRPSVGSWVAYGLGSENRDLPAYVVLPDPGGGVKGGPPAWGSGFLPATYQGITMRPGNSPLLNLKPPPQISDPQQRATLDLVQQFNREHLTARDGDDELAARVRAYELAFRMQSTAPELVNINDETAETQRLYGLDENHTKSFGQRCLLARRMIERGVRFVQVYSGDTNGWDAHNDVTQNHTQHCRATDKPVAGLLRDLKRRGLWDETLVIWGGEFGRMPMSEQGKGRDHNPWGYTVWFAGGGVRAGMRYGATDAVGLRAEEKPLPVRDLHATILHLLGLKFDELTYYHNGLEERLTGPAEANVVHEVLA